MSRCTRCGADFSCGAADGGAQPCWCMALPPLVAVPQDGAPEAPAGCWCPVCLKAELSRRQAAMSAELRSRG